MSLELFRTFGEGAPFLSDVGKKRVRERHVTSDLLCAGLSFIPSWSPQLYDAVPWQKTTATLQHHPELCRNTAVGCAYIRRLESNIPVDGLVLTRQGVCGLTTLLLVCGFPSLTDKSAANPHI